MTFAGKSGHQHFHDGTFSLSAPVAWVMANSMARMLWFWGLAALVAVIAWRVRRWRQLLALALGWGVITLLPYSFLTYMPRVPSRHTYFASAALGWVVAAGLLTVMARWRRSAVVALVALLLVHNSAYVWTRKHRQFLERAMPTEQLLSFVRENEGEIYVHCFPYHASLAVIAAEVALKREVHTGEPRPGGGGLLLSNQNHVRGRWPNGRRGQVNGRPDWARGRGEGIMGVVLVLWINPNPSPRPYFCTFRSRSASRSRAWSPPSRCSTKAPPSPSSPATARRSPATWTRCRSATSRRSWSTSANSKTAGKPCCTPSRSRASSRRN